MTSRPQAGAAGPKCKIDLNHQSPIVCVSDTGAPDRKKVHAVNANQDGRPTMITWIAPGHTLQVEMTQPGCVTQTKIDCQGAVCTAITLTTAAPGTVCSYKTWVDGKPGTDPDVEIDPCC